MRVSLSWLKDYVLIEKDVNDLAEALTMAGIEVDAITDRYDYLDSVYVGRIVEVSPHPHADMLTLCKVQTRDRNFEIVCGAPNVDLYLLVPVALPGTVMPDGSILKTAHIRGICSEAMLCSEFELGLGADSSGIMILDSSLTVGDRLSKALNLYDPVLEIDLTPNRSDCLSILGVAREIAAIQSTPITYPEFSKPEARGNIFQWTSVTIDSPKHCPRYVARLLVDIAVAPSPFWLRDRLLSIGLRPINNIVDVTNYTMMETGQPLHAFDFDQLTENRIIIRTARDGEQFTTLDRKSRTLSKDMLLICDGQKPVAIAGVMGGLNSEIETGTSRVLIESAYFNPISIRKTSKSLGLSTDASHRFERGVDPKGTVAAANRAARLMADITGGRLIDGVIDVHPIKIPERKIQLRTSDTNRILGTYLDRKHIESLLTSIEFDVTVIDDDTLAVVPPSFRMDIERPEDLMEEVARRRGYHNIPTTFPLIPADTRKFSKRLDLRDRIKNLMTGFGFNEIINYSFIHERSWDRLGLSLQIPQQNRVRVLNPLSEEQTVMRTSLIPGLLESTHRNLSQQIKNLKFFETGKIFISTGKDNLPEEIEILAGLWTGSRNESSWHYRERNCDFYDVKGAVEGLLEGLWVYPVQFTSLPEEMCTFTSPGHTAQIFTKDTALGLVGELSHRVMRQYDIKQQIFVFELNLELLLSHTQTIPVASPIPKYPSVSRDVTLIVDKHIEAHTILEQVRGSGEKLVEDIRLFDVFEGKPIQPGKKSISFRIIYRSAEETLQDEKVTRLHKDMTFKLVEAFDATLPG